MPLDIQIYFSNSVGGSPDHSSRKFFREISADSALIVSQLHYNEAHWWESRTPCLQNLLDAIVVIDGDQAFYDVAVTVEGTVYEHGSNSGIPRVSGGMTWRYDDDRSQSQAKDMMRAKAPPPPPRITPVGFQYAKRIRDGIPTVVARTVTTGAMTITNPASGGLVSLQNVNILKVGINFLLGWGVAEDSEYQVAMADPGGPGTATGTPLSVPSGDGGMALKPIDLGHATIHHAEPDHPVVWEDDLPEDEATLAELLGKLNLDLAAIRALDQDQKGLG